MDPIRKSFLYENRDIREMNQEELVTALQQCITELRWYQAFLISTIDTKNRTGKFKRS
jgi:hypothetical protein